MTTESTERDKPGLVGYIGAAIVFAIVGLIIYAGYTQYLKSRPAVISLSAYFVDSSGTSVTSVDVPGGHLKIKGEAHQDGVPLRDGSVRVAISKQDKSFQQTISIPLKNGQFQTEDPSFRSLKPRDQLHVTAEVWSSQLSKPAIDELYVNTAPPVLTLAGEIILWAIIAILIFIFFFSFTGKKTPAKNRVAVIFSYTIIGIFIAVPLLAPVLLLHAFPNLRGGMIGAPVGLVVTRIGREPSETQWALNIGGYSTRMTAVRATSSETRPLNAETDQTTSQQATSGTSKMPKDVKATESAPVVTGAEAKSAVTMGSGETSDVSQGSGNRTGSTETPGSDNVVVVQGGLVVPLYVIILSVIGGAINMTRKVPQLQREGEYAEVGRPPGAGVILTKLAKGVESSVSGMRKSSKDETAKPGEPSSDIKEDVSPSETKKSDPPPTSDAAEPTQPREQADANAQATAQAESASLEDRARDIDTALDELVKQQVQRKNETDRAMSQMHTLAQQMRDIFDSRPDDREILGFTSFEDWLGNRVSLRELLGSSWRVELLNQYMYLISAPFLAIVAYYMLDLLGLTKQPILVLIAFSVGLISERILSWLLGIASGYLRSEGSNQSAGR